MVLERPIQSIEFAERVIPKLGGHDLTDAREYAQRAERQRIMGELASDVVHDINNLLAAVEAISRLLEMQIEDDALRVRTH